MIKIWNAAELSTKFRLMLPPIRSERGVPLFFKLFTCLCFLLLLNGCTPKTCDFEPTLDYTPQVRQIQRLPSPFEKLTKEEVCSEWGKELYIGLHFGNELDLYRAITAFKRALILIPASKQERRMQIEYYIVLSYYLGKQYNDAVEAFESSRLIDVPATFGPCKDLGIVLFDCYQRTGQGEKAARILEMLRGFDPELAQELELSDALIQGDLDRATDLAACTLKNEAYSFFLQDYLQLTKSPQKARRLNAVLPGAGYAYVGQKQTAVTSFLINALFIGASYYCVRNGNIPLGVILGSLETGWYIGGIHGSGLAAIQHNELLYEAKGKDFLVQERLFPVLMLEASF